MKGHQAACVEGLDEREHDGVIDVGMGETEGMANLVHKGLQERQQLAVMQLHSIALRKDYQT